MARTPRLDDFIARSRKQAEHIRQLRSQKRCHTADRTFVVDGDIATDRYVGPLWVCIDPDGNNPEFKTLYAFRGVLRTGTCTIQWLLNGVQVGDDHDVTAVANQFEVTVDPVDFPAANLNDGDTIRPVFLAASGAADLSVNVVILTVAS